MKQENTFAEGVVAFLFQLPAAFFMPWVLLKLYEWHVMLVWTSAPDLTYQNVFGIVLFLYVLRPKHHSLKKQEEFELSAVIGHGIGQFIVLSIVLLLGWWAA